MPEPLARSTSVRITSGDRCSMISAAWGSPVAQPTISIEETSGRAVANDWQKNGCGSTIRTLTATLVS
jgi:hypothetical protein